MLDIRQANGPFAVMYVENSFNMATVYCFAHQDYFGTFYTHNGRFRVTSFKGSPC
jgi:hypothetical protein